MDNKLTDLDALILTVRNPLSRSYIDEAVRAYRAGSYKAAIVAIWVAVSFDIIGKIRELADDNDPAASAFVTAFDNNVTANNVTKLLEIEGNLLEEAELRFFFLDSVSRRHFERLKQDRNLCAHPAFNAEGSLFMPEPELVRLYIVEAVRNLLSQRPVQGKTIITMFDRDFKGTTFPQRAEQIPRFVENRYLANTRRVVLASFAQVLAKALLKAAPAGWELKLALLPYALQAVKQHDAEIWTATVLPNLITLVESADDAHLPNAFQLLSAFPDLLAALPEPAFARLRASIENLEPDGADLRAFEAATIPTFEVEAVAKFEQCPRAVQGTILSRYPCLPYWPTAKATLEAAGSYRGAEALFAEYAEPFRSVATAVHLSELLDVVRSNGQISYAAGVPTPLAAFAQSVAERHIIQPGPVAAFIAYLDEHNRRPGYDELIEVLEQAGVPIPPPPAEED